MKLVVLTEYSQEIGFGHVNRTLSLADEFFSEGWAVEYCIRDAKTIDFDFAYRYHLLDWSVDTVRRAAIIKDADVIVIDTYRVDKKLLDVLVEDIEFPVTIIDSTLNYPSKGMLIFGSGYAKCYSFSEEVQVLAGPQYMLFRKDFIDARVDNREISDKISNVVISLGKFAKYNVLAAIVEVLSDLLPESRLHLIGILDNPPEETVRIYPFLTSAKYVSLLQSADLVICNGGQTLNECVALNIPNVSVLVADNQRMNIEEWEKRGVTRSAGAFDPLFKERLQRRVKEMISVSNRRHQYKRSLGLIDLAGPRRIFKYVVNEINSN